MLMLTNDEYLSIQGIWFKKFLVGRKETATLSQNPSAFRGTSSFAILQRAGAMAPLGDTLIVRSLPARSLQS